MNVATRAFRDAPTVIIKALKRLTWAGERTVDGNLEEFVPFNELLSIGYFEDAHIGVSVLLSLHDSCVNSN